MVETLNDITTLAEATDQYLILRGISKKKYYPSFLVASKWAWRFLFKNTIYSTRSEWFTLKAGTPYNYIDVPRGTQRIFSVATLDKHCNKLIPLFYNNGINIIPKPLPSQKKCGCGSCDCSGLCEDANSLTYTTKVLFSINGVDYIEKTWVKVCPNGDVLEFRTVPVKKYNNFTGDPGDYNNDYMNDFDIGHPPFSDYTIVYEDFQKIICKLDVQPCGCPIESIENEQKLNEFCGCFLPANSCCKKKHCNDFLGQINNNCKGEIKISDCGTKIYFIPHKGERLLPDFLLLNWQTSGENCDEYVQVPDYAMDAIFAGVNYYSMRYNNSYSINEKMQSKWEWQSEQNNLISYLNPLSLEWLSSIQDCIIKY